MICFFIFTPYQNNANASTPPHTHMSAERVKFFLSLQHIFLFLLQSGETGLCAGKELLYMPFGGSPSVFRITSD